MTSNSGAGSAATVPTRGHPGSRPRLPERFCNLLRLLWTLDHRGVPDGIVLYLRPNVFYLSGYSSKPSAAVHETNGYGAVILSPRDPDHPILIVPEHDVAFFVRNPTWIKDIRAYASAINPRQILMDGSAFDRIVPSQVSSTSWGPRARTSYEENLQLACR